MLVGLVDSAASDVLVNQPHDFRTAVVSDWWAGGLSAQMGDDFTPDAPVVIESATFWMIASWASPPLNWTVAVHRSTDQSSFWEFSPEYPWMFERTGPSSVTDLGMWNNEDHLHLFEVRFDDLNLYLDPATSERGTFWFSSFGHISHPNEMISRWGTAGNGELNGDGAWAKTIPWTIPGWQPLWLLDDTRTDMAMRIEGHYVPAPGIAVPLLAIALRRRRSRKTK